MKKLTLIWISTSVLAGILCLNSSCSKKTEDADPNLSSMVWVKQNSGTYQNLYSVHFPARDTGYAVGCDLTNGKGLILKTTNGGITWIPTYTPDSTCFISVKFLDVNTGYAVGDKICKTTDGGKTWTDQSLPDPECFFNAVCFTDRNTGYIAGAKIHGEWFGWVSYPVVYKTLDGGLNWTLKFLGSPEGAVLSFVFFIDANTGYSGAKNSLIKTIDGGNNWTDITTTIPGNFVFDACCFADNNTGYIVGGEGILKTNDGGTSWEFQHPPNEYLGLYNSVYFTSKNRGYIVGGAGRYGLILETSDGGATWKGQILENIGNLRSVYFPDANTGYAVGDGGILKTTVK